MEYNEMEKQFTPSVCRCLWYFLNVEWPNKIQIRNYGKEQHKQLLNNK